MDGYGAGGRCPEGGGADVPAAAAAAQPQGALLEHEAHPAHGVNQLGLAGRARACGAASRMYTSSRLSSPTNGLTPHRLQQAPAAPAPGWAGAAAAAAASYSRTVSWIGAPARRTSRAAGFSAEVGEAAAAPLASSPPLAGAPQPRPHPRQQLLDRKRFGEVVVGAGVEGLHPLAHRIAGGEHQHRRG